jgi:LmbE family N-acetylglucosaminyl deacetylase
LAFGAHPDDIEFGCGGLIARETQRGRPAHFVLCSRGEAGSHGTPEERAGEAAKAAAILGGTLEFIDLDGDAHLQVCASHAVTLAGIVRRLKPSIMLAPTLVENQHPDHFRLGQLVRDAARLARYGGLHELRSQPPHAIDHLFYYALSPDAEPKDITPLYVDISPPEVVAAWIAAMEAHASQVKARDYVRLQLARANLCGVRFGLEYAIALFPNDPLVVDSLAKLCGGTRRF